MAVSVMVNHPHGKRQNFVAKWGIFCTQAIWVGPTQMLTLLNLTTLKNSIQVHKLLT